MCGPVVDVAGSLIRSPEPIPATDRPSSYFRLLRRFSFGLNIRT